MSTSIVSGVDAAPVLEASEHVLDAMALAIERTIVRDEYLAIDFRGDARVDAACDECGSEPIGIIASVGEHGFGRRQGLDQDGSALEVAGLPFAQRQSERAAAAVADGVELGGQAATAAPDTSG